MTAATVTLAESLEPQVRARLAEDIANSNPNEPLAPEDVFDVDAVVGIVAELVRAERLWTGTLLDVEDIDDPSWVEVSRAAATLPWVLCSNCCPTIFKDYEPCADHDEAYTSMYGWRR